MAQGKAKGFVKQRPSSFLYRKKLLLNVNRMESTPVT